ncbi:hypothetical protein [Paenibacillus caseinilyticus]|uniref:hypothetical protein n=1 Tax=Paenibacillus caseinilyticus TaxID=3098138 RepID=UPI0022B91AD2|nr:hypothetical protein [Paenibacillus caseinilyticus]MCZ8518886.1 hypothetical protein [Paenibacillus caseinilyticus]
MEKKQKHFTSKVTGKQYIFQFPGIRAVQQIRDRVKNRFGVASDEKSADEVLKYVVVDPKMRIEDFGDDIAEFNEVVGAAINFMNGADDEDDDQQAGSEV